MGMDVTTIHRYIGAKLKDKKTLYKISISIILGLIGFSINFLSINFYFTVFKASFMLGLVLPMVVTLAWGWRYGLLSATIGLGCQSGWFMWLKTSGWETFVSVPPFTLWVVWHGWFADRLRKGKLTLLNKPYLVEIPFRIFNTIILYTLFRWVFQFNPAPWAPEGICQV